MRAGWTEVQEGIAAREARTKAAKLEASGTAKFAFSGLESALLSAANDAAAAPERPGARPKPTAKSAKGAVPNAVDASARRVATRRGRQQMEYDAPPSGGARVLPGQEAHRALGLVRHRRGAHGRMREMARFQAILQVKAFQQDPLTAVTQHLQNSVARANHPS